MKLRITVQGTAYDVDVEILDDHTVHPAPPILAASPAPVRRADPPAVALAAAAQPAPAGGNTFVAPLAGTIRGIHVKAGDQVKPNDEMLVLEAMKMETAISSDRTGRIKAVLVSVGDAVKAGQALVEFE